MPKKVRTLQYYNCRFAVIFTGMLILSSGVLCSSQPEYSAENTTPPDEISVFIAGDAIITQPWSHINEPEFLKLIDDVSSADVAAVNLEMLIHDFEAYPSANSGGTWMAARPVIAQELKWAGFDMVSNANNHSFDYGTIGVLKTVEHIEKAGIKIAGVGKDLQRASAPVYYDTPKGRIALISTASTFTDYGRAGRSRPDIHGRPGLNPLEVNTTTVATITQSSADNLRNLVESEGIIAGGRGRGGGTTRILGQTFQIGDKNETTTVSTINELDLERNLNSIREARQNADIVIVTIHQHGWGGLVEFAHKSIEAGADLFFGHGPHVIRGIEMYRGKPIFYSLGDFVFQNEQVEFLPDEFFRQYGLGDEATPEEAQSVRSANGTRGFPTRKTAWEGLAARINFKNGEVTGIRLIPVDMGFGKPLPIRGMPKYADNELGKYIIDFTINVSKEYGTEIEYIESENIGIVKIK
jgi:poly-gamma-glutamate capsule biosynthesis protein CapA/YwtB (metallophosphatase superfamily)